MISIRQQIVEKLTTCFNPEKLEVRDQSHLHAGHGGARPEGETHFEVMIIAKDFEELSAVKRHQEVYNCLGELMQHPIHALSLKTIAPSEQED